MTTPRSRGDRPPWWDESNDRALLICRISDRKQLDGVSLEAQEHILRDYVQRVRLRVAAVRLFQESAKRSALREQFHAALETARRERIRHAIFYVWDRIARNSTDAEILEEHVRAGEIVLHVASGGTVLHANSDDSEFFLFDINIANAKQENRGRRRKTLDGMMQRCRNGWYPSRPPTFYWQEAIKGEDGRLKRRGAVVAGPSDVGRVLLKRQAQLRINGSSLELIRQTCLNEGLVPSKLIPRYRTSLIERMLKNPFYAAIPSPHDGYKSQFIWRGVWYEGKHEPVYTAHEWDLLRASFGRKAAFRKRKHEGLFSSGSLRLTCADPACGCQVTYAPKTKPGGPMYPYYRCTDGKRVHIGRGEKQVNVLENDILAQLASAMAIIHVTDGLATTIATALSETHRHAQRAKQEAAAVYRAQLVDLDGRADRLYDRLDKGEIDSEGYRRQTERLRQERDDLFEKLRDADRVADDEYLVTADRVLELAKSARTLWDQHLPEQQRDLLSAVVCNPRLDQRTVRFDLQKPFEVLVKMRLNAEWRPQRELNSKKRHFVKWRCRSSFVASF
jgi:DNA invertase Pin-like site-specific DNA recombinase